MLAFIFAIFAFLITPGPGVLSVMGVGAGFGFAAGSRYLWGLCLGNFLIGLLVVSGLAATVLSVPYIREILLTASIAYLLYLAAKVAFAGSKVGFVAAENQPGFRDGILLQFINPKAYVVNTALFTGFAFWPDNLIQETLAKVLIYNALWIPFHFMWLMAGITIKRLALSDGTQRLINYTMAFLLVFVVVLAVI